MSSKRKYIIAAAGLGTGLLIACLGTVWLRHAAESIPQFALQTGTRDVALDEDIVLHLDNLSDTSVLIPSDWQGVAIYRQLPSGNWAEYYSPDLYAKMVNTAEKRINYRIPGGELKPGVYLAVVQGMRGKGESFAVEVQFTVNEYRKLQVALVSEEQLIAVIINNRECAVELGKGLGMVLEHKTRSGWQALDIVLPAAVEIPTVLAPGQRLELPIPLPGVEGELRLTAEGIDEEGHQVRGQAQITLPN